MQKPTLYLMLGYPGAGKTTTANIIHELTGAVHLSSDELRGEIFPKPDFSQQEHENLYKTIDQTSEHLLQQGKSVIYDANLNRLQHRQEKYAICKKAGATPVLLWVQAPRSIAKQRAAYIDRQHLVPDNETPDEMFERIANVIEEPKNDEPYTVIDGTKVTKEYVAGLLHLA